MNPNIQKIQSLGFRITRVRKALIEVFQLSKKPLSVSEILKYLYKKDLSANKTTIYRELEFLKSLKMITEIEFGDGKKRYEIDSGKHHHHIVCVNCGKIEDIELKVELRANQTKIEKETGFRILEHSIEFFGICKKCQH